MPVLSPQSAEKFYDRFGAWQDWQSFYESAAIDRLITEGAFNKAQSVCEFGCGTGRMAELLLQNVLPPNPTYLALDISATMIGLAEKRLTPWSKRSKAIQTNDAPTLHSENHSIDRVLSTYVLDLLSEADIRTFLTEARRALKPSGMLCNVSLMYGQAPLSKAVSSVWQKIHNWRPEMVGGCRPVALRPILDESQWHIEHLSVVRRFGICSEVLVARLIND